MAFSHGSKAVFWLDNSAGTLVNLTSYITSVNMPSNIETAETTVLGKTAKTYVVGLIDHTISIEGKWDPTLDAHISAIKGQAATVTFEYGPEGGTTGKVKETGEAILTSYEVKTDVGDAASFSAELQVSDSVTRTTFA